MFPGSIYHLLMRLVIGTYAVRKAGPEFVVLVVTLDSFATLRLTHIQLSAVVDAESL